LRRRNGSLRVLVSFAMLGLSCILQAHARSWRGVAHKARPPFIPRLKSQAFWRRLCKQPSTEVEGFIVRCRHGWHPQHQACLRLPLAAGTAANPGKVSTGIATGIAVGVRPETTRLAHETMPDALADTSTKGQADQVATTLRCQAKEICPGVLSPKKWVREAGQALSPRLTQTGRGTSVTTGPSFIPPPPQCRRPCGT